MASEKKHYVGAAIAKLRTEKGWSQAMLAEELFVNDEDVINWETDIDVPDTSQFAELAKIFNVSIEYLMSGKTAVPEPVVKETAASSKAAASTTHTSTTANSQSSTEVKLNNRLLVLRELFDTLPHPSGENKLKTLKDNLSTGKKVFHSYITKYPIHYYEYCETLLQSKDYKTLFEFAVDFGINVLADAIMSQNHEKAAELIKSLFFANKHNNQEWDEYLVNAATERAFLEYKNSKLDLDKDKYHALLDTQQKNAIEFSGDLKPTTCMSEFIKIKNEKLLNWSLEIEDEIESMTGVKQRRDALKRVKEENNDDYLVELAQTGKLELCAIKLCVKLEVFLRYFFNCDDTLNELLEKFTDNSLLHKLRQYRNTIAHSAKIDVRLNKYELLDCIETVSNMIKEAKI